MAEPDELGTVRDDHRDMTRQDVDAAGVDQVLRAFESSQAMEAAGQLHDQALGVLLALREQLRRIFVSHRNASEVLRLYDQQPDVYQTAFRYYLSLTRAATDSVVAREAGQLIFHFENVRAAGESGG